MYKFFPQILLLLLAFFITACANLPIPLQPVTPQVSLADFKLVNMGIFEQNYRLRLRLKNPNPFALPVNGMDYQLDLNDTEFARGKNNKPITIPASGEEFVDIDVTSNLMRIVGKWQDLGSLFNHRFSYRLSGHVNVMDGASQLPFEYQDEIFLGKL